MSLKEDLARNRAVFERLTADTQDSPEPRFTRRTESTSSDEARDITVSDEAKGMNTPKSTPFTPLLYEEPGTVRRFSLSSSADTPETEPPAIKSGGVSREIKAMPEMKFNIESIGESEYPPLRDVRSVTANPLEALYHQLDIEARQVSQILSEGDL